METFKHNRPYATMCSRIGEDVEEQLFVGCDQWEYKVLLKRSTYFARVCRSDSRFDFFLVLTLN